MIAVDFFASGARVWSPGVIGFLNCGRSSGGNDSDQPSLNPFKVNNDKKLELETHVENDRSLPETLPAARPGFVVHYLAAFAVDSSVLQPPDVLLETRKILSRYLGPGYTLYLFGSRATGTNSENSDFDFLVDSGRKIDFGVWAQIKSDIEDLPTLYSVDITDKHAADPDFLATIQEDLCDVTKL